MPIRIYALAKQLKLDSKVLVDICTRAGVTGKGSALASLTDDEMTTVTNYMAKRQSHGGAGSAAAPESTGAFRREDYIAPAGTISGKIPILETPKAPKTLSPKKAPNISAPAPSVPTPPVPTSTPAPSAPSPATPAASSPAAASPAASAPTASAPTTSTPRAAEPSKAKGLLQGLARLTSRLTTAVKPGEKAPQKPAPQPPAPQPPKRVQLTGQQLNKRFESILDNKPQKPKRDRNKERREERDRGPAIKMAPLPPMSHAPRRAKSSEPAPQKPDIRLPPDAIRAGKAGSKPLSEHLRKHEQKRIAAEAAKGSRKGGPATPATLGGEVSEAAERERVRRGGRAAPVEVEHEEEGAITLGGREQRQLKRKKAASVRHKPVEEGGEEETTSPLRRRTHIRRTGANTAAPRRENVTVQLPCTVRSFSEAIGVSTRDILAKLLELGTMTNITAALDADMAELLAAELGVQVNFRKEESLEERLIESLDAPDDPARMKPRPPIVTFLGHVDHGKTSLLDKIIGLDVAAHEKGGITQHIRAYRVDRNGRSVAFVDTPGHEAFTEMRARGANVTDIAVLVVAADDGVMPQTEEAISHAKAADVPIVVAMNKIDLPGANPQRVMEQLAANELLPSEWGGETEVVKTSAATGEGIDKLIETLLTVAELHEYKADPDRPARGTCLEAELNEGRGVVAKVLVRDGSLRPGDVVVCGAAYGRVKAMYDTLNPRKKYDKAGPSTPVNVTGLDMAPGAGDHFYVMSDITQARQLAEQRAAAARQRELGNFQPHVTLETLYERLGQEATVRTLNIILRADVRGSIEAIRKELSKLQHPEVQIKILQATVGGVTEADVHLAHASDAVIIGFSVVPDEKARILAEKLGVQIRRYDIIYQVTEELKAALEGMLKPEKKEKDLGRALVQQVFHISKVGAVAGCRVLSGTIARDARVRLIRESRVIGDYALESLKREKDDAREVREGLECGMKLANFNDVKEGDLLEAYKIEEVARTF